MTRRGLRGAAAAALILGAGAAPARAIDPSAGTSGATFLKLGAGSPRAQALGGAFVAVAEGPDALVWNPAGLALSEQREGVYNRLEWIGDFTGHYLGFVHPTGRSVWGANFGYFTLSGFDTRDSNNERTNEPVEVKNGFFSVAASRSFFLERLFLGLALKGVLEDNGSDKHNSVVGDFGALFKPSDRLSFGFAAQGLGGSSDDVVRATRIGAAMRLNALLRVSFEVAKHTDDKARPGVGFEFTLPEELLQLGRVDFRVGFQSSDNRGESDNAILEALKIERTPGISFGLGVQVLQFFGYGLTLDYALVPLGSLGTANQIGVKMRF